MVSIIEFPIEANRVKERKEKFEKWLCVFSKYNNVPGYALYCNMKKNPGQANSIGVIFP